MEDILDKLDKILEDRRFQTLKTLISQHCTKKAITIFVIK